MSKSYEEDFNNKWIVEIREKYGKVIGLVSLLILLGNLRNEYGDLNISLTFAYVSLRQVYYAMVIGVGASIYLYTIDFILDNLDISLPKIFSLISPLAYYLFIITFIMPILLLFGAFISYLLETTSQLDEKTKYTIGLIIKYVGSLSAFATAFSLYKKQISLKTKQINLVELIELWDLQKAYDDGSYNHTILEAFKVLELRIRRLLYKKGIRYQNSDVSKLLDVGLKHGIVNENDLKSIKKISEMRNAASHLGNSYDKDQAEEVIQFVKDFISRTNDDVTQ